MLLGGLKLERDQLILITQISNSHQIKFIISKFALNVGLQFKTPESFYLGEEDKLPELEFDLNSIAKTGAIFKGKSDTTVKKEAKESRYSKYFIK